nr:MAG TPA: hypothetical protein [Caudoviricetes sp.]
MRAVLLGLHQCAFSCELHSTCASFVSSLN